MEKSPKIFIVVLNWNGKAVLRECLRSVFAIEYGNFEVVVVDNASRDGSLEAARSSFGRAHFIVNDTNNGFAAGMNIGMKFALSKGASYVWVLNNDTVCGRESLRELLSAAKREKRCAIFSPLILTPSGKSWFSFGKIDYLRMRAYHADPDVPTRENEPYESGYLSGCAMFFSAETIRKIGFFDEKYFLYYEDADLSVRAEKAGCRLLVVPKSVIVHGEQSGGNREKTYWLVRSGLRFFSLHTPPLLRPWMILYILLRKVKNRMDKNKGKEEALLVSRAYADYRTAEKS